MAARPRVLTAADPPSGLQDTDRAMPGTGRVGLLQLKEREQGTSILGRQGILC